MANLPVTPAGAPGRGPAGRRAHSPGDRAAERLGSAAPLVARVRHVHLEMVDAVLGGEGLGRVAELTAAAAGAPVALVVPRAHEAGAPPPAARGGRGPAPPAFDTHR